MNEAGAGERTSGGPRELLTPAAGSQVALSAPGHPEGDGDDISLQWTARDRWFFAVVTLVILLLLGIQLSRLAGWGLRPLELARPEDRKYEFQIDINSATWVEWMQLEGLGEATARKIVADREANGPFKSIEDVQRVKGIGPATLEKMRPWLRWSSPEAADEATGADGLRE